MAYLIFGYSSPVLQKLMFGRGGCFSDAVHSGLHSHQPILLHGKVWLSSPLVDPPDLDVWGLILPPVLPLLGAGLHKRQQTSPHARKVETERFNQRTVHCGGQRKAPSEWQQSPLHQRQNLHGQSQGSLTLWPCLENEKDTQTVSSN